MECYSKQCQSVEQLQIRKLTNLAALHTNVGLLPGQLQLGGFVKGLFPQKGFLDAVNH